MIHATTAKISYSKLFYVHKNTLLCKTFSIADTNHFHLVLLFREYYINGIIFNIMFLIISKTWELVEVCCITDENFNHDLIIVRNEWRTHKSSLFCILYSEIVLICSIIIIKLKVIKEWIEISKVEDIQKKMKRILFKFRKKSREKSNSKCQNQIRK